MTFESEKPQETEPKPGVEVDDQIYVHHGGQPCTGRVCAHGKHGVTVEIGGRQHKVKWQHVLGHKTRSQQRYNVIDEGEDGMLVEDANGRRRFIAVGNESKEDPMVMKALARRPVLFMKASAPRAGLQQKQITDKNGVQTTRWVSTDKGQPPAQRGQHVGYENGEHRGHGQVMAAGQHGVTVRDPKGGEHRIHHEKITHHWHGDSAPDHGPHTDQAVTPAEPAQAEGGQDKPFFNEEDIAHLPDPKKFRHAAFKNWEEAEAKATQARDEFYSILKGLGKKLSFEEPKIGPDQMDEEMLKNDKRFLFMGPIKKQDKSTKKVMNDYGGDWGGLKDVVRATVAVKTVGDVHNLLAGLKESGVQMLQRPKDNMTHGTGDGYRDINMILAAPNGMPVELQVQVKAITRAKSEGHEFYNENIAIEQRNKGTQFSEWSEKDRQEFAKNRASQKKIYGRAWSEATGKPYEEPVAQKTQETLKKSHSPNMIIFVKGAKNGSLC